MSDERIDLGEILARGAERRTEDLRAADRWEHERRARLLERIRSGDVGVDVQVAAAVRREGWARPG